MPNYLMVYTDPDFSKSYRQTITAADPTAAGRQLAAFAHNREYSAVPLSKHVVTDPHIIRRATSYAKVIG